MKRKTKNNNKIKQLLPLFFSFFLLFFSSCSLPEEEKTNILKIMDIRENLLNKGDINSLSLLLTDDFKDRQNYLNQLQYRRLYFSNYLYVVNSIDFASYSPFLKRAVLFVNYNLSFKSPQEIDALFWLGRLERVVLTKEKIGWKIAEIEDLKDCGEKIEPQTVRDVFFALDTRRAALCNRDAQLFETIIHSDYPQREGLIRDFEQNSKTFSDINYRLKNRNFISFSSNRNEATVVQEYDLSFTLNDADKPEKIENQKEIISLKKNQKGLWQITSGLK